MIHPFVPYLVMFGFSAAVGMTGILCGYRNGDVASTTAQCAGWVFMVTAVATFTWDVMERLT